MDFDNNCIFRRRIKVRFVSNMLLTVVWCTTLKPNGKFCHDGFNWRNLTLWIHLCLLKSHLSCLAVYIYFVLNSAQSSGKKKISGNVTVKNYLKESLLSNSCFIIHGQGSSEKRLILNCDTEIYLIAYMVPVTWIVFLVCTHTIEIGRGFLASNNKYFVCFNKFYAGKVFVRFFVQMNAQK